MQGERHGHPAAQAVLVSNMTPYTLGWAAKWAVILSACAILAGCATETLEESYRAPLTEPMHNIIADLTGKPESVAFARLHYPDDQKIIADRKVYIWADNGCSLRLFVDDKGIVQNGDWTGNIIGCSVYIQRVQNAR